MYIIILFLIVLGALIFIQQPKFGKTPRGERLEKIKKSPNYKNDTFQNLIYTPVLAEGSNYFSAFKGFIFRSRKGIKPPGIIPSQKANLLSLNTNDNILVWFGHSSYFIQIDGKKILVDPVFSGAASPIPSLVRAFKGTDPYTADDIPEIDYLFITHDHWDHLDYKTVLKLKPKIKKIICGLGVGEHFEYWGFDRNIIIEKDWNEKIFLDDGFVAYTTSARHFSGRSFQRNKSLWTAFIFQTPASKIFFGNDGGYGPHFINIWKTFGDFDLAILENGQYDKNWKYIHSIPEEVLQAAKDLHAKQLLPIHSSKFILSFHPWDEPLKRITKLCENENLRLLTPMIGERVNLKDSTQKFREWWKDVK